MCVCVCGNKTTVFLNVNKNTFEHVLAKIRFGHLWHKLKLGSDDLFRKTRGANLNTAMF